MKALKTIFIREIAAYFDSSIGYIFSIVFLLLTTTMFMNSFFLNSFAEMDGYFEILPYILIIFIPTISMRLWAEERKHNTYELLMTLPIRNSEVILGKYLASLAFFTIVLLGTLPIVVMLFILGQPDGGKIFSSYLGAVLMGGFFLSVGIFLSGITSDQIVAYLLTSIVISAVFLSGNEKVAEIIDGLWPKMQIGSIVRDVFSAAPHYEAFTKGIIAVKDVLYFILFTTFFIIMNDFALRRDKR